MRRGAARGTRRPGHVPGRRGRVWLPCTQRARRPRPAGRPCTRRLATAAPAASRDRGFTPCLPGSRTQIRGRVRNPGTAGDPLPECAAAAARGVHGVVGRSVSPTRAGNAVRVLLASWRPPLNGAGNTGPVDLSRRRNTWSQHTGSCSTRSPAADLGRVMTRPWPLSRNTVPVTATVPASTSTSDQETAHALAESHTCSHEEGGAHLNLAPAPRSSGVGQARLSAC